MSWGIGEYIEEIENLKKVRVLIADEMGHKELSNLDRAIKNMKKELRQLTADWVKEINGD